MIDPSSGLPDPSPLFSTPWLWVLVAGGYLVGAGTAVVALMGTRTPQGSVAWILSLLLLPWIAVPLYLFLGRARFEGYVSARRGDDRTLQEVIEEPARKAEAFRIRPPDPAGDLAAAERLARIPLLGGNRTQVLHDGEETFDSIFEGIRRAERDLLVQYYILRDDELGRRFADALLEAAGRGVKVRLLVDRVGSASLPDRYLDRLEQGGIRTCRFSSIGRRPARLQINFRNHRKIVVVDGREGWMGGLNVGDEYLGLNPEMSPWRDIHLHIRGPAALALQLVFLEDWYWACNEILELEWTPVAAGAGGEYEEAGGESTDAEGGAPAAMQGGAPAAMQGDDDPDPGAKTDPPGESVLVVPSGPADPMETASLLMQHAIHVARERFWISSPYFVPDRSVQDALRLAVLRGVEVRILIPKRGDNRLLDAAGFAFHADLLRAGVRIFRFRKGFLHAKTALVDREVASVGTVNLDNRSLRLNFEITALLYGRTAVAEVERHFLEDFEVSDELALDDVEGRSFPRRVASRIVYLFAPLL